MNNTNLLPTVPYKASAHPSRGLQQPPHGSPQEAQMEISDTQRSPTYAEITGSIGQEPLDTQWQKVNKKQRGGNQGRGRGRGRSSRGNGRGRRGNYQEGIKKIPFQPLKPKKIVEGQ